MNKETKIGGTCGSTTFSNVAYKSSWLEIFPATPGNLKGCRFAALFLMSFKRHSEIYPNNRGADETADAPAHRLDEFPAVYSLTGCSPAAPASASPAGVEYMLADQCHPSPDSFRMDHNLTKMPFLFDRSHPLRK
jgi:hypothetical protein